jgi:hypothetical protein
MIVAVDLVAAGTSSLLIVRSDYQPCHESTKFRAEKARDGHDTGSGSPYSHRDDDVRLPAGPGGRVHDISRG